MKKKDRVISESGTKSRSSSGDASPGQARRERGAETFAASQQEPASAAKPPIGTGPKIHPRPPRPPGPPIGTCSVGHQAADDQDAAPPPIGTGPTLVPPYDIGPPDDVGPPD